MTREAGLLYATAKGAKKAKSRLAGISEPLSASTLHVAEGRATSYITQAQPATSFPGLRSDYDRLRYGLSLAELSAAVLPYRKPTPEAFTFLLTALHFLESHPDPTVAYLWAETRLLGVAGFNPSFNRCVVSGVPIDEASPFVSARAGGYVCEEEASQYADCFRVRAEALFGLAKLAELTSPPAKMKHAHDAAVVLYRFWLEWADCPLPATGECVEAAVAGIVAGPDWASTQSQ